MTKSELFNQNRGAKYMLIASLILCLLAFTPAWSWADVSCMYTDSDGIFRTTSSMENVPEGFRDSARCSKLRKRTPRPESEELQGKGPKSSEAKSEKRSLRLNRSKSSERSNKKTRAGRPLRPNEVELSKARRTVNLNSSLGKVDLRWDRSAERFFGKAPERAVQSAMTAASRVLAQNSFPADLRKPQYDWRVVIMDEVPANVLINMHGRCHPAWMRPPADIFVSARDLATVCGHKKLSLGDASIQLQETLVHEIGHAIEFQFMKKGFTKTERWHNEGFATWFESMGANYISGGGINRSEVRNRAKRSWHPDWRPGLFQGTGADYARAYSLIAVIAEKKSILRLADVYKTMSEMRLSLLKAIEKELGWDEQKLLKAAARHIGAKQKN